MTMDAFLRLETLDDLRDAVILALSGYNLTFEPVTGAIGGRVRLSGGIHEFDSSTDQRIRRRREIVEDTPSSIGRAVRLLGSNRLRCDQSLHFEFVGFKAPARKRRVFEFLIHINQAFDMRCKTLFSQTDIIGVMEWLATLVDVEIVAQIPYASGPSSAHWGRMLRGETVNPDLRFHLPENRIRRTLFCHARPTSEHLIALRDWARTHGTSVLVVNGAHADRILPGTRGTSADGSILLGNHCLVERVKFNQRPETDVALYAALRAAGRLALGNTWRELPEGLQAVWDDQSCALRPCAVENCAEIDWETFENHVSYGAIKQAGVDEITSPHRAAGCYPVVQVDDLDSFLTEWVSGFAWKI